MSRLNTGRALRPTFPAEVGKKPRATGRRTLPSLVLVLLLSGCGNSAQKSAYEKAVALEQQQLHQTVSAESAASLIHEYQNVIRLEPGSAVARQAQARIAALEARVKAEETHKSVFQEHGVD